MIVDRIGRSGGNGEWTQLAMALDKWMREKIFPAQRH